MIHKFLIVNKQELMLSSIKMEDERQTSRQMDLLMPLEIYWDIAEKLRYAQYLLASDEEMADINEVYKAIFRKASSYAVYEVDRAWLYQSGLQKSMGAF